MYLTGVYNKDIVRSFVHKINIITYFYVFYILKQCILCNINYSKEVFATCPVSVAFCQKFMSVKTVARPFL